MTKFITVSLDYFLNQFGDSKTQQFLSNFKCKKEIELETFLHKRAISYQKVEYGKTYLMLDTSFLPKKVQIAAFFTIAQQSVGIKELSKNQKRKILGSIPGRDKLETIACYLIGQIGRDDNYTHKELPGSKIIKECYNQINIARRQVGGNLLILECRPKMYSLFYKKQGFKKMPCNNNLKLLTLYRRLSH